METGANKSVLVAMSGGVDSSVAALLLQRVGYKVVGVTMRLWVDPRAEESLPEEIKGCCSLEAVTDAAKVADKLGIPHYVMNMKEEFYRDIVCNFSDEYLLGRTPNPCVECNRAIKFSALFKRARGLGIKYFATGHYARIIRDDKTEKMKLFKGLDGNKDQSYMLYILGQEELQHALLPLGHMTKNEVRQIAEAEGLVVADKAESQEICFIPDNDYRSFLKRERPEAVRPGDLVSASGEKLGRHQGIAFYTIGQRKGLGLTTERPMYVIGVDAESNRVIVGFEEQTYSGGLIAGKLNYISGESPGNPTGVEVKIRYRTDPVPAILYPPEAGFARVEFQQKQKAVTPGQSAVFYSGEEVLGGGIIESSTP
jgi:tRNA-uridine 2-sulfurtransferase